MSQGWTEEQMKMVEPLLQSLAGAKTLYVVRKGTVPGIYTTWDECKEQVSGYQGAEYKKFKNVREAIDFLVTEPGKAPSPESVSAKPSVEKTVEKKVSDVYVSDTVGSGKAVYGVQRGFQTGVYGTWDECKKQTEGFSGPSYRKFKDVEAAKAFVCGELQEESGKAKESAAPAQKVEPDGPYAFVDGSFNSEKNQYGYGGFVCVDGRKYPLIGSGKDAEMASMRNVAGEIMGAMAAVEKAEELRLRELTILYDYRGIEEWATGSWKATKQGTQAYQQFMNPDNRLTKVSFQKVAAHTGIEGNEMADVMAKYAVGIVLSPSQEKLLQQGLSAGNRDGFGDKFDVEPELDSQFSL